MRMMDAILYRLRRLRGIRAERFRYCIRRCAERSHRSRLCIFADMLICYFLYGAVYTDYLLFGFDTLPFAKSGTIPRGRAFAALRFRQIRRRREAC